MEDRATELIEDNQAYLADVLSSIFERFGRVTLTVDLPVSPDAQPAIVFSERGFG